MQGDPHACSTLETLYYFNPKGSSCPNMSDNETLVVLDVSDLSMSCEFSHSITH